MDKVIGIDLSHYEPAVDWQKAQKAGVQWMYTKVSEGLGMTDKMANSHTHGAAQAGVLTQGYHFFHAAEDGIKQAEYYLAACKGLNLMLPHILDWESASANGVSSIHQQTTALAWLGKVESESGKIPWIYTGESFMRALMVSSAFKRYPLIVAHYGVSADKVRTPLPWDKLTGWQYTDSAHFDGIAQGHHVDANYFYGSIDDLKVFTR